LEFVNPYTSSTVSVIHFMYNSSINRGVTANKNMFSNNVQTLSGNIFEDDKYKAS
jgi:hypothetical protein